MHILSVFYLIALHSLLNTNLQKLLYLFFNKVLISPIVSGCVLLQGIEKSYKLYFSLSID